MIQYKIEQYQLIKNYLIHLTVSTITNIRQRIMTQELAQFIRDNYHQGITNIDISSSYQLRIGPQGAAVIASAITWPIDQINLNMYFIESEGMQAIINNAQWPSLKTIILEKNNIGCDGLQNIDKANWNNMIKINLNKNGIKAKGFQYLVNADWPLLKVLQLSHNQIGLQGAMQFSRTNWPNLRVLNLNYNLITNEGMRQISKCYWPHLHSLQLSNNKLDAKAMFYLSLMELPSLKNLSLNRNQIGKDDRTLSQVGCYYLSRIKAKDITSLHIFGNEITINGIRQVMYSGKLAQNCFLQVIRNLFTYPEIQEDICKLKLFCNVFT